MKTNNSERMQPNGYKNLTLIETYLFGDKNFPNNKYLIDQNGKKQGKFQDFNSNGKLICTVHFKDDQLNGIIITEKELPNNINSLNASYQIAGIQLIDDLYNFPRQKQMFTIHPTKIQHGTQIRFFEHQKTQPTNKKESKPTFLEKIFNQFSRNKFGF